MDELSNAEARRDFNVANLRRALGGLDLSLDPADRSCRFSDVLRRLAARDAASLAAPTALAGLTRSHAKT